MRTIFRKLLVCLSLALWLIPFLLHAASDSADSHYRVRGSPVAYTP